MQCKDARYATVCAYCGSLQEHDAGNLRTIGHTGGTGSIYARAQICTNLQTVTRLHREGSRDITHAGFLMLNELVHLLTGFRYTP